MKRILLLLICAFVLGWIGNSTFGFFSNIGNEMPFSVESRGVASPSDWIKESQVELSSNSVIIHLENSTWARFSDTHSMAPTFDSESNSVEIAPQKEKLNMGDIISYHSSVHKAVIIHRIVYIGKDESGWFCLTKGDNNKNIDGEKIRFEMIKGVVVALLY